MTKSDKNIYHLLQLRYGIIGSSGVMQDAIARLAQVAPTDLSVLITGETGTGKEVFANAIHNMSNRKKQGFISVNCGAIPETLLESELFGHEKGAFTGATEQRKGYFEVAHNGTIFLDEIGEMPVGTQVKLLRVLETGEFNRLGSTQVHKVDVRLVAATNRDLEYEVRRGNFREDLYFRLNAVQIHLPPLRKHPEDVALLVEFFANRICERNGFIFEGVTDEAIALLEQHPWRGNIRELRNLVETLVTIEQGGSIGVEQVGRYLKPERYDEPVAYSNYSTALVHIPSESLPPPSEMSLGLVYQTLLQLQQDTNAIKQAFAVMVEKLASMQINSGSSNTDVQGDENGIVWDKNDYRLEEMERKFIIASLKRFDGNRRSAAKALGISERTLYRKLIEYKLTEIV